MELARKVFLFLNNDCIAERYFCKDVLILFIFVSSLLTLELCKFEESVVQLLVFCLKAYSGLTCYIV